MNAESLFKTMDIEGNNSVDNQNFVTLFEILGNTGMTKTDFENVFYELDMNDNGEVTL